MVLTLAVSQELLHIESLLHHVGSFDMGHIDVGSLVAACGLSNCSVVQALLLHSMWDLSSPIRD